MLFFLFLPRNLIHAEFRTQDNIWSISFVSVTQDEIPEAENPWGVPCVMSTMARVLLLPTSHTPWEPGQDQEKHKSFQVTLKMSMKTTGCFLGI